ncbi:hypothetical protein KCU71_g6726, partial [Aureobasidium melanogenum]
MAYKICSLLLGLTMLGRQFQASAMPLNSSTATSPLYDSGPDNYGVYIWILNVTSTVFGQDATNFDYHLAGESAPGVEAVHSFAAAFNANNDDEAILTTFLNATMAGTMTAEQAANRTWLCQELSGDMASTTQSCDGVDLTEPTALEKRGRGRFGWIASGAHISSKFAMEILQRSLESRIYDSFSHSPRSWCNAVNGVTACLSWSAVENWQHNYAVTLMSDALSYVDFDRFSAQANRAINGRKRGAADVCLSNRADGCT